MDLLVVAAGAVLGLAVGYIVAEEVGRVSSRRIARLLARWRGRRARKLPSTFTAEDAERLEARVLDALRRDVVLGRRAVRVRVLGNGIVELSGRVDRPHEVDLAGDVVREVPGVMTALNHLLVPGVDTSAVPVSGPNAPRAARG